jgi:hypothetical protein
MAPTHPLANETITVTIHPRWPLRKGDLYEVIVTDTEGHPGDAFVHAVAKKTRSLMVQISAAEGLAPEAKGSGTEWARGNASLFVIEGTPRQLTEISLHPKWRQVGGLEFRFS